MQLGQPQREQVHHGDLAEEGLRRGDRDLEAGAREEDAVGVARRLRAHDVRDGEDGGTALLRDPHRRERVGGLAGLRDADDEIARADDRVAVAVLAGDLDLDRHARELLDRVAADQARVERGAAGDDDDALGREQLLVAERALVVEVDAVRADGAVGDRLGERVRLLVDLLEHERLVAALLGGLLVPVHDRDLPLDDLAVRREDRRRARLDDDDLAVLDVHDAARLAEEGRDRRGEEALAVADAGDQRALLARADQQLRRVEAHRDERVVALQLGVRGAHGRGEVAVVASRCEAIRCAITSASVSLVKTAPSARSRSRSAR